MEKKVLSPFELFTTGLALLALGVVFVLAEKYPAPFSEYDWALRRAGWVVTALSLLLIGAAFYRWSARSIAYLDLRIDLRLRERLYLESSYCEPSEIREICEMGVKSIGENHASADLLLNRLEKCPHLVKKLTRQNSHDDRIRGFYIVYPLTSNGVKKIERQMITGGKGLLHDDIAANFRSARAVYVSMVYGDTSLTQANAVFHLINDLKQLTERYPAARKLYAKPSTAAGLRLMQEHKFKPVDDEKGIWKLAR